MDDTRHAHATLAAWVGTLLAAIALFTWLGAGRLGAPALTDPSSWDAWAAQREAPEVVFALGRVLVLALAWYLVGVTTLGVVARWARSARMLRVADALAVPSVRRVLQASLGLGLATAAVASSTGQVARPLAPPVAVGVGIVAAGDGSGARTAPEATPSEATAPQETAGPGAASTPGVPDPLWHLERDRPAPHRGPDDGSTPGSPPDVEGRSEVVTGVQAATIGVGDERTWVVQAGDHLWSIAERVVGETLGRPASDPEVVPYWRLLIEANRAALVHADDPDLILPGQRFVLPAVPA